MPTIAIKHNGTATHTITSVMAATKTETLAGEKTLSFTITKPRASGIVCGDIAELDGDPYRIVRIGKSYSGGFGVYAVSCEHVSYALSDLLIEETVTATGSAAEHLARILTGTGFSAGTVEGDGHEFAFTAEEGASVRETVMKIAQTVGLEFEFTGYTVNFPEERGGNELELPEDEMVTDISVTIESRAEAQSYDLTLRKPANIAIGDTVHLTFTPMEISVTDRVTAITINPFYQLSVSVTVGGAIPDYVTDEVVTQTDNVKLKRSYFGNVISKEEGFVSTLMLEGEPEARIVANGQYFALQKYDGAEWDDCVYFDVIEGKYVFEKDVNFNGNLIAAGSIQFQSLDNTTKAAINDATDVAESIANGTYSGGTFINGTSIYSPNVFADEFIVQPATAAAAGQTKGGYTLKGYFGQNLYEMLNIRYIGGLPPTVELTSDAGAYARWNFDLTDVYGAVDFRNGEIRTPVLGQFDYGSSLPSTGVEGQVFFLLAGE